MRRATGAKPSDSYSPIAAMFDVRTSRKICSTRKFLASSTKRRSSARPMPFAARVRHDRQIEDLRFAGRQHQHAVGDDPELAFADARRVAGGERVAEIADRPRRGVDLRFQRRDVGEVVEAQRPPLRLRPGRLSRGASPSCDARQRRTPCACSAAVSATRWRTYSGAASAAATPSPAASRGSASSPIDCAVGRASAAACGKRRAATRARDTRRSRCPRRTSRAAIGDGDARDVGRRHRPRARADSRHPSSTRAYGGDVDLAHPRVETGDDVAPAARAKRPPARAPRASESAPPADRRRARVPAPRRSRCARR